MASVEATVEASLTNNHILQNGKLYNTVTVLALVQPNSIPLLCLVLRSEVVKQETMMPPQSHALPHTGRTLESSAFLHVKVQSD